MLSDDQVKLNEFPLPFFSSMDIAVRDSGFLSLLPFCSRRVAADGFCLQLYPRQELFHRRMSRGFPLPPWVGRFAKIVSGMSLFSPRMGLGLTPALLGFFFFSFFYLVSFHTIGDVSLERLLSLLDVDRHAPAPVLFLFFFSSLPVSSTFLWHAQSSERFWYCEDYSDVCLARFLSFSCLIAFSVQLAQTTRLFLRGRS